MDNVEGNDATAGWGIDRLVVLRRQFTTFSFRVASVMSESLL